MEKTITSPTKPLISTHVLDTSRGVPAHGMTVRIYEYKSNDVWDLLMDCDTDKSGRVMYTASAERAQSGRFKIQFGVGKYYTSLMTESMYPIVEIIFDLKKPQEHYHIPLLLSPYGFTTYRGS